MEIVRNMLVIFVYVFTLVYKNGSNFLHHATERFSKLPYYIRKGLLFGLSLDLFDYLYRKQYPEHQAFIHLGLSLKEEVALWFFLAFTTLSSCFFVRRFVLILY